MRLRLCLPIVCFLLAINSIPAQQEHPGTLPATRAFSLKEILPANLVALFREARLADGALISGQDDPDGCCIQSNGSSKSCSKGIKKKQCYDDCEVTGCKADWHAGACSSKDGCD